MDALILGAGYAKRMWPLTKRRAKLLLPLGDRPVVSHIIERLQALPMVRRVWLVTNQRFYRDFQRFLRRSPHEDVGLLNDGTRDEAHRLGAIGDLWLAIRKAPIRGDLLVVGGDNLFTFSLVPFVTFAQAHRSRVTVGVVDVGSKAKAAHRYGVVRMDRQSKVVEFQEKPAKPKTSLAALCLYWFSRASLTLIREYLQDGQSPDAPGHLISWLVARRQVYAYRFRHGMWYDIGNLAVYRQAAKEFRR